MNIWALDKDPRLKGMLLLLVEQLGHEGWGLDQNTAASEKGVWLSHPLEPGVRAYLYVHGQESGCAGVHLEYPDLPGTPPLFEYSENVAPERLADILAAHFGISTVTPIPWSGKA